MIVSKLSDMKSGWYAGNFEPTAYKTKAFELNYRVHKKGEFWEAHTHTTVTEINLLISGSMEICNQTIGSGDIFIIEPGEVAAPIFLTDCEIVCAKTPSSDDKIIVSPDPRGNF
jgi:quercetin dioxygenase-like cupin family protein